MESHEQFVSISGRRSQSARRRRFRASRQSCYSFRHLRPNSSPFLRILPQSLRAGRGHLFWADLDDNGALDLIASTPSGTQIWLGDAAAHLHPLPIPTAAEVFGVEDINGDGRLDFVGISSNHTPVRVVNQGGVKNYHWQVVRPRSKKDTYAEQNKLINSFAIGGSAELRAGLLVQKQPITGPTLHFGLGQYKASSVVRMLWPNGGMQAEYDLQANSRPAAVQRLDTSCPWLFAFNGRSMQFVTDILWKSPLGLRINPQDTAGVSQTRDWVKILGDQLQPHDGFYDLSVTAELWEADFFDFVSLMAVDHPVGTEVFVDERFAIPQPPLALIPTAPVIPVQRAVDDLGHDATEWLRKEDGRYVDSFGLGEYQGITRDHYVEVEVPESAPRKGPLWLVAAGWVYPTNSSVNVAISQGRHDLPRSLSLEIPDAQGDWVPVRKNLGFPAGKTKTVMIDLTNVFHPGAPRRLRLRTNMEVYWDSIGFAAGLPQTSLRTRLIAPSTASLRYRGFSLTHEASRTTPELPDYNRIAKTGQQYLDLEGYYTRYGDVRELLKSVDDRYVIMDGGDEMKLRFAALPPPAAGWTRDFVFVSDGWDKDGNFNTGFSRTVLPLPSHSRPAYNVPPGPLQADPVYRAHPRDWQQFQTRYVTQEAFRRAIWPG